ncbi:glutaredoxin family protein [Piscinibacter sp. XHJ-5]|uniref:glutaredoxin family protein n=1 Tax=Piscinibacter sp. XHJ-5 TaxID=3037797 RepID=UPI00245289A9|nr:glutaredoxin family protein [Piscinibacter sp. XHJ-5]
MTALRRFVPLLLLVAALWGGVQLLGGVQDERRWREVAQAAAPGDIVMLSSQTCAYCDQARTWLSERGVPFRECVIERDAGCAAAYRAALSPGTPTLIVRGQRIVGFDIDRVAQALKRG